MTTFNYIIVFGCLLIIALAYLYTFIVIHRYHWLFIFKGRDRMELAKLTSKQLNYKKFKKEYEKLTKKQEERKFTETRKKKLEKLNKIK